MKHIKCTGISIKDDDICIGVTDKVGCGKSIITADIKYELTPPWCRLHEICGEIRLSH